MARTDGESALDWIGAGTILAVEAPFAPKASLLSDIRDRLSQGSGFAIATMNLDHVVKLRRCPDFREAYAAQTHVTADGYPIVWLEALAGRRAARVTGADLVLPVARLARDGGHPVALFGSSEASLAGAARAIKRAVPGTEIAFRHAPSGTFDPGSAEADIAIDALCASGARLCFLALGAPKQEIFAARARARCPGLGIVSVGAGLDFLSGAQRRAPWLVQSFALEWIWRLGHDPSRLAARYARCAALLPVLAAAALQSRRQDLAE